MRISVISFTDNGAELARQLKVKLTSEAARRESETAFGEGEEITPELYRKSRGGADGTCRAEETDAKEVRDVEGTLDAWTAEQFAAGLPILFISACGIAVRAVAPYVKNKLTDSPVLVMDEKGRFVIPLLSGHVGGANELAKRIAVCMDAVPVITTATDLNDCFAVDLFAKENQLRILKREGIAEVSGKLLSGREATVSVQGMQPGVDGLPDGLMLGDYPPADPVDIVISGEEDALKWAACPLQPKVCAVGIGCRKGKDTEELEDFFLTQLSELELSPWDVFAVASIEQKSDEEGICRLAEKYRIPFVTFSAGELQGAEGEFSGSAFVEERMGVDNVCERAALLACGTDGELILGKQAERGMTIAVARRTWSAGRLNWKCGETE